MSSPTPDNSQSSRSAPLSDASGYWLLIDGHRIGPLDAAGLRAYELRADRWVWHASWLDWQQLGDVAELRPLLDSPPPIPTPATTASTATVQLIRCFRRAVPFLAISLLSLIGIDPLLLLIGQAPAPNRAATDWVFMIVTRLWSLIAISLLANGLRFQFAWLWIIPALIHPYLGMAAAGSLGVIAQRRLKAANVRFGFFGPVDN